MKRQRTVNSLLGMLALGAIMGAVAFGVAGNAAAGETLVHDGKVYVQGADGVYRQEGSQSSTATSSQSSAQNYAQPSQSAQTRIRESNAMRHRAQAWLPLGPAGLLFR